MSKFMYNIYKAKYIQCVKKKKNQRIYLAKIIRTFFKTEYTWKINTDTYQPKVHMVIK